MVSGVFCFVRKDSAIVRLIALMFRKYRYRIDRASPEGRRSRIEPGVFGSSPGRSNSSARSRNRSFPTRCDRKSLRPDRNRQNPLRLGPPPRSRLAEGCIRKTGACGVSRGGRQRSKSGENRIWLQFSKLVPSSLHSWNRTVRIDVFFSKAMLRSQRSNRQSVNSQSRRSALENRQPVNRQSS